MVTVVWVSGRLGNDTWTPGPSSGPLDPGEDGVFVRPVDPSSRLDVRRGCRGGSPVQSSVPVPYVRSLRVPGHLGPRPAGSDSGTGPWSWPDRGPWTGYSSGDRNTGVGHGGGRGEPRSDVCKDVWGVRLLPGNLLKVPTPTCLVDDPGGCVPSKPRPEDTSPRSGRGQSHPWGVNGVLVPCMKGTSHVGRHDGWGRIEDS